MAPAVSKRPTVALRDELLGSHIQSLRSSNISFFCTSWHTLDHARCSVVVHAPRTHWQSSEGLLNCVAIRIGTSESIAYTCDFVVSSMCAVSSTRPMCSDVSSSAAGLYLTVFEASESRHHSRLHLSTSSGLLRSLAFRKSPKMRVPSFSPLLEN